MLKKLNQIQAKAKKAALKALKTEGKALLHMATGTGKTETAIKIFSEYEKQNKRMLWITHKTDLVEQSAARIMTQLGVDTTLFGGASKDNSGQVVVASVQSLSKASALAKFDKNMFDLVIVDEAHHAPAKSWTKSIEHFNADKLALTATPYRPDKQDLGPMFGDSVFSLRFSQSQKMKLLAPNKARLILTTSSIAGLSHINKDYTKSQLEKLYASTDRNKIIVNAYLEFGRKEVIKAKMKPKAICFCINTKHARRMAKLFKASGINAGFLSSKVNVQNANDRELTFKRFSNTNEIEVLCAVDILNEGTDIPDVNIGLMARPTRSNIIYTQQIGRLARADKGNKKFFIVLDFVDNTRKQYSPYTAGNLTQRAYTSSEVITKYVSNQDPIDVNERVENIMKSVEDFEDELNYDLLKSRKELIKEANYFKQFGKHSKEFLNENKKSKTVIIN